MSNEDQRELWQTELEALEATYGILEKGNEDGGGGIDDDGNDDDVRGDGEKLDDRREEEEEEGAAGILTVVSRCPPRIRALLVPRGQRSSSSRFVRATLVVDCSEDYCRCCESNDDDKNDGDSGAPSSPPPPVSISLASVKGLGDARRSQLLSRVAEELAAAGVVSSSFVLGSLVEAALEAITELNAPEEEGACPICLEPLVASPREGGDGDDGRDRLVKLGCYHCLHLRCAARWWRSSSSDSSATTATTTTTTIANDPRSSGNVRSLRCPQCREVAAVAERAAARLDALAAAASAPCSSSAAAASDDGGGGGGDGNGNNNNEGVSSWGLSPQELETLRKEQERMKRGLEEQEKRGALVSERWAVSLSELTLSAAAAAAAAAAATTATSTAATTTTVTTTAGGSSPSDDAKRNGNSGTSRGGQSGVGVGVGRHRGRGGGGGRSRGRGRGGGSRGGGREGRGGERQSTTAS